MTKAGTGPGDFADLFSAAAVDELVSERGLRTPFLRMAKNGSVLASSTFTRGGGAGATITDQVADDKVLGQLAGGATLVLQALHRSWPPLVRFGSDLAAELGHPVQINAYITPPQNQGFAAHYDTHDVFVLQIAGSKRWRIHEPVLPDPLPHQTWDLRRDEVQARAAERPLIDTLIEPGDALYLPRGFLHSAVAQGELTIHLTIGVHPLTGYDLARELVAAAEGDRELRRSLPLGVDVTDVDAMARYLRTAAERLAARLEQVGPDQYHAAARRVGRQQTGQTRPAPIAPLAQLAAVAALGPDTRLVLRPGLRPRLRQRDDAWVLDLIDSTMTWPDQTHAALLVALSGKAFAPEILPNLDPDEQLVVARRLLREGIVVPTGPTADGP
ncbi:cupin domain-containing protein [Nakamurella sp.]|uniref:cupin domain-containing protein n=1 Tax=Nakamurella sp. TaxID=1869182 RepID=UPI003784F965